MIRWNKQTASVAGLALFLLVALLISIRPLFTAKPSSSVSATGKIRLALPEKNIPAIPRSFYGIVTQKKGSSLVVDELIKEGKTGKSFALTTSQGTEYFIQQEAKLPEGGSVFVPERSSKDALRVGQYVFAELSGEPSLAVRITFSSTNPF